MSGQSNSSRDDSFQLHMRCPVVGVPRLLTVTMGERSLPFEKSDRRLLAVSCKLERDARVAQTGRDQR